MRGMALGCVTLAAAAIFLVAEGGSSGSARAADAPSTLTALADRAQIEDLLVDYYAGFSGDHQAFASYYADDGILDVNGIVTQGKQAISDFYSHSASGPTRRPGVFRMLLTNIRISVNGMTAKADALWTGIQDENVKAAPQFVEQGREHDELVKQNGRWLFKHRWITTDAGLPAMYEKTYKPRNP